MRAAVDLLTDALEMPAGGARLQALDAAARAADAENDDVTALSARESLVDDANDVGDPERMLQAFTWCLAHHDKHEIEEGAGEELLWRYKWVIDVLPGFPQITRARIAAVLDDFERRFRIAGNQMRAVHGHRATNAARLGDVDDARVHLSRHHAVARDGLADCHACEADAEVELLVSIGDPTAALEAAHAILAGRLSCAEVPARTWAHVLLPLLDVAINNDKDHPAVDAAISAHLKGMRGLATLGDKKVEVADAHLTFLAVTGNFVRGLNLLKKVWPLAIAHTSPQTRMRIHAAAACLLGRIAGSEHGGSVHLDVPANLLPPTLGQARVDPAALAHWLEQDALAIAARFDARNGNDAVSRSVRQTLARAQQPWDRPLSKGSAIDHE